MNQIFKRKQWLASIIVAMIFSSKAFIILMSRFGILPFSPGIFVMSCVWILYLIYIIKYKFIVYKELAMLWGIVFSFFTISKFMFSGHIDELFISFFQYCTIGMLVGTTEFDIYKVFKIESIILICIGYPTYVLIQRDLTQTWQAVINMDLCYGIIPILLCVLSMMVSNFRDTKWHSVISYVIAIIISVLVITRGTRGGMLCFLALFLLLYLNSEKRRGIGRGIKEGIIIIVLLIVLFNADVILTGIYNLLSNMGYKVNFIQKSIRLLAAGDISNGRTEHYMIAWRDFLRSPLFGNGVGQFATSYPSMGYPHNMILQALYEGGILLGIPIIVATIISFKAVFFTNIKNTNIRLGMIVAFSFAIPAAMLSSELWVYPILWFLFGLGLTYRYRIQEMEN